MTRIAVLHQVGRAYLGRSPPSTGHWLQCCPQKGEILVAIGDKSLRLAKGVANGRRALAYLHEASIPRKLLLLGNPRQVREERHCCKGRPPLNRWYANFPQDLQNHLGCVVPWEECRPEAHLSAGAAGSPDVRLSATRRTTQQHLDWTVVPGERRATLSPMAGNVRANPSRQSSEWVGSHARNARAHDLCPRAAKVLWVRTCPSTALDAPATNEKCVANGQRHHKATVNNLMDA